MRNPKKSKAKKKAKKPSAPSQSMDAEPAPAQPSVWRPGVDPLDEGEVLQYDPTAYDCLHPFSLEWPCLSFDIIRDELGGPRTAFPHVMYLVAGTQASTAKSNTVSVVKLSNLGQGRHGKRAAEDDEDMSDSDDSDDDDEEPPKLHSRSTAHHGCVNRVRGMVQRPGVVATWSEGGQVQIWDLTEQLRELAAESGPRPASKNKTLRLAPLQVFSHPTEGYALDWSTAVQGLLASGDNRGKIHVWQPNEGGKWSVSGGYSGHTASVEEIQWSHTEGTVFASGGVDKTIRIWDTRERSRSMLSVAAHDSDVNVMSWNREVSYMLASGADDGTLRVWDLRNFKDGAFVANFTHHRGAITGVEWCPHETSMCATSSSDNTLAVWDLAVERDPEEEAAIGPDTNALAPSDLPPQLLFIHAGQQDMKELHWHPQIPGMIVNTAADGFNVFKPANL